MYASKLNQGFFPHLDFPGFDLSDAVWIGEAHHGFLMNSGKPIDWSGPLPQVADTSEADVLDAARIARVARDHLLRNVYDVAATMLQRGARLYPDKAEQYAAKLAEFDTWAVALQAVPDQPGFPHTIEWPVQPTAEAL